MDQHKYCNGCKKTLLLDKFGQRMKRGKKTYRARCKKGDADSARKWRQNNPEKFREQKAKWNKANPRARTLSKWRSFARKHGLDPQEITEMIEGHCGKCDICGETQSKNGTSLHVDHCHSTHRIRGLLCDRCNIAIGHLRNDPQLCRKAAKYLM